MAAIGVSSMRVFTDTSTVVATIRRQAERRARREASGSIEELNSR
jgi:hypothetical protein